MFVESELWPNLLRAAKASGAKLVLMGARISEKSARRWDRRPAAARAVLGLFDLIYPQDFATADWLDEHGVMIAGRLDLKRGASPLPCDEAALAEVRRQVGGRKVALAASTHSGEEAFIADAVWGLDPRPLLVVVPRHPERGRLVALSLETRGWTVALRSKGQPIAPETQVYVADTLGELGAVLPPGRRGGAGRQLPGRSGRPQSAGAGAARQGGGQRPPRGRLRATSTPSFWPSAPC